MIIMIIIIIIIIITYTCIYIYITYMPVPGVPEAALLREFKDVVVEDV